MPVPVQRGMTMAIEFHCNHCGRLIRASAEHGGKRGKCPSCHQSIYIPTPSEDLEPLPLAPLDQSEEHERERLLDESRELAQRLRDEKDVPPEAARPPLPEPVGDVRLDIDMEGLIIDYAAEMAAGNLAAAEELAADIRSDMPQAEEVIQRLMVDELPPPRLAKIPRPVLVGFLKQLRESS